MELLVVAATKLEIEPFLATNPTVDILISGVGNPATIFNLNQRLAQMKYDLVIQAGIAGTFNNFIDEDVVVIEEDTFADIGVDEKGNFKTIFEMGLANENEFPYKSGWLKNANGILKNTGLRVAKAITVNKITDDKSQLNKLINKFGADVETMEGAAFHYVCLQHKINFLQLRSISNIVGDRDKARWKITEAIESLNHELQKILKKITQV